MGTTSLGIATWGVGLARTVRVRFVRKWQQFDPLTAQCITQSGRVYRLLGRPGLGADAEYVWNSWKRIAGVGEHRDVTREVFDAMKAAQASAAREQGDSP